MGQFFTAYSAQSQKPGVDVNTYLAYVQKHLVGFTAKYGSIELGVNGGRKQIPCVSIEQIPGLPEDFKLDLVPRITTEGIPRLEVIIHGSKVGGDKYKRLGNNYRIKYTEFGNGAFATIRDTILEQIPELTDISTVPIQSEDSHETRRNKEDAKVELFKQYANVRHMYYDMNFNGGPAYVLVLPENPYEALTIIIDWYSALRHPLIRKLRTKAVRFYNLLFLRNN